MSETKACCSEKKGTCAPGAVCCPPRAWNVAAGVGATLIAMILMTAAVAKVEGPSKSKLIELGGKDYLVDTIAGPIELAIVIAILLGFRLRLCWACVAAMFGGFAGYSLSYYFAKESCGCFGALLVNTPLEFLTIKGVSTIIDVVFVLMALGLLAWRGCMRWPMAALVLALIAGTGGFFYANHDRAKALAFIESMKTPPLDPASGEVVKDAPTQLFESALLADIRAQPAGGPAWYIFVYDPDCSECMELHPYFEMDMQRLEDTDDPFLRVRMFTKQDLDAQNIVKFWDWPTGASMLLIRDGVLTNVYSHDHTEDSPTPDIIYESLEVDALEANYP